MQIGELFRLHRALRTMRCVHGTEYLGNEIGRIAVVRANTAADWTPDPGDLLIVESMVCEIGKVGELFDSLSRAGIAGLLIGEPLCRIYCAGELADLHPAFPVLRAEPFDAEELREMLEQALRGPDHYSACVERSFARRIQAVTGGDNGLEPLLALQREYTGASGIVALDSHIFALDLAAGEERRLRDWFESEGRAAGEREDGAYLQIGEKGYYCFPIRELAPDGGLFLLADDAGRGPVLHECDFLLCRKLIPFITLQTMFIEAPKYYLYASKQAFLDKLILGQIKDEITKKYNANHFKLGYVGQRVLLLLEFALDDEARRQTVLGEIKRYLGRQAAVLHESKLNYNTHLLALNLGERSEQDCSLKELFDELASFVPEGGEPALRVSVSSVADNLGQMSTAFEEAELAMRFGRRFAPEQTVYHYNSFVLYHLFSDSIDSGVVYDLYRDTIRHLTIYDNEHMTQLVSTLEVLVLSDFNILQTANSLYIHRNTLYKRIRKINEILGMDIEKGNSAFLMRVAVKLYQLFA